MMAYATLIIALLGLLVYLLSSNGKAVELGRILFFCGVLAFCFHLSNSMHKLF